MCHLLSHKQEYHIYLLSQNSPGLGLSGSSDSLSSTLGRFSFYLAVPRPPQKKEVFTFLDASEAFMLLWKIT